MLEGAVPECQRKIDEIIAAVEPATTQVDVKDTDQVLEVLFLTEPLASPELG